MVSECLKRGLKGLKWMQNILYLQKKKKKTNGKRENNGILFFFWGVSKKGGLLIEKVLGYQ